MQRSILVLVAAVAVGCTSGAATGGRPANGGLAYRMDAEHAESICEEAIQQTKPETKYKPLDDMIGFQALTISFFDWAYHFVRAERWPTSEGGDAYSFYSGWRGTSEEKADARQESVDRRLDQLLAEETLIDAR